MPYITYTIASFKSRALQLFWEKSDGRKLPANAIKRVGQILNYLHKVTKPEDMNIPSLRFHGLKGKGKRRYSVRASGNYRITFAWDDGDAVNVDYEDYH